MALKFTQKQGANGGDGGTYNHDLLINRGLPDQHTIESVTGLREALNRKYEKPFSGIPRTDLGFDVATKYDLQVLRNTDIADINTSILDIANEIYNARGDMTTLRQYIDTKVSYADWSGSGGNGSNDGPEVGYPLYEQFYATDGQLIFPLPKTYKMNTHQLQVYLHGILMVQDKDYKEVDDHTVEFLYPLEEDDHVLFMVRSVVNSGLHEEYTATEGQKSFSLVSPYGIYQNILQVYRNGVLQRKGRDYKEVDRYTIEFYYPLETDEHITFHQAGATDPLAGTIMESEIGRMKMNQAYTTMKLHDAIQIQDTDYIDMYVDTFITDQNIDKEKSLTYQYMDQSIQVDQVHFVKDTKPEFLEGTTSGADMQTYYGQIRLQNLSGGAEQNTFTSSLIVMDGQNDATGEIDPVDDIYSLYNNRGSRFDIGAVQLASGMTDLYVFQRPNKFDTSYTVRMETIHTTDGYVLGIEAESDEEGRVHIVCQEYGTSDGRSKIYYILLDPNSQVIFKKVISDLSSDAITPDIDVEKDGTAHIVFASKRIAGTYFNIDYRIFTPTSESGFYDVSVYTNFDCLNPSIAVGNDRVARIVLETTALNGVTKNLKYHEFEDGIKMYETYFTNASNYDNVLADIDVDSYNTARIVWRSKRLGLSYGIDYCSILPDHTTSSVKSIASGTPQFSRPRIGVDYENISHVTFHGNVQQETKDEICYTIVYADNTVAPYSTIAYDLTISYHDPNIHVYGENVVVSFIGAQKGSIAEKKIVNFSILGRYTIVLDSRSFETSWSALTVIDDQPSSTLITYEYRVTDDKIIWSEWKTIDQLSADSDKGRFLEIRATLETTDVRQTPTIQSIEAICRPDTIEIQSVPKHSSKEVTSIILVAQYEGEVTFEVSRDNGVTFVEAPLESAVNVTNKPIGQDLIVKAKIKDGSRLDAWGMVW